MLNNLDKFPFNLPLEIPHFLHPLIVHFAVSLPFVIIIIEVMNLFSTKKTFGALSFLFMLLLSGILYLTILSGKVDMKLTIDTLSNSGKFLLREHIHFGIYLFYTSLVLIALKLITVIFRAISMKTLFLLALIFYGILTIATMIDGTRLVYSYKSHTPAMKSLKLNIKNSREQNSSKVESAKSGS